MDKSLENWRKQIDKLDEELLKILAKRINVVREIGKYKKTHGLPPRDEKRWQQVLQTILSQARLLNISEKFIENLYNLIHKHSLEIEKQIK